MRAGADGRVPVRPAGAIRRILIVKPSSLGDIVHALPVLWAVRRGLPRARISWLVSTGCAGLLEGHPAVDEVIRFDRRLYGGVGRVWGATAAFARFLGELAGRRFDVVLDLQGLFRSAFLAWASGAPVRVGLAGVREVAAVLYTHRAAVRGVCHAVERNLAVCRLLGVPVERVDFDLGLSAAERGAAEALRREAGIAGRAYAVLAPGARWETKRWPEEAFAAAGRRLGERFGAEIVVVGAPEEAGLCERVARGCGGVSVAGRASLRESAALMADALVVVSNDSGTKDVAAAAGAPVVSVFGPTDERRVGPRGERVRVVRRELACAPCYLRRLVQCPHDHACLRGLSPEVVVEAVEALVGRGVRGDNAQPGRGSALRPGAAGVRG